MITRIVKLNIKSHLIDEFTQFFAVYKQRIMASKGCIDLEIYRSMDGGNTFFTISTWDSEMDLSAYKQSLLFKTLWPQAKEMFEKPALAWSMKKILQ